MLQRVAFLSIVIAFALVLSTSTTNAQLINWNAPREGTLIDSMNAIGGNNWAISYGIAPTGIQVNKTTSVEGGSSVSFTIDPTSAFRDQEIGAYAGAISRPLNINLANAANFYFWVYTKNASELVGNGNYGIVLEFTNDNWVTTDAYCPVFSAGIQKGWTPVVIARSACQDSGTVPIDWSKNIDAIGFRANLADNITKSVMVNFDNLRYNYGGGPFNEAQVILTFDGGWNSTYFNASEIMKNNGQTGVMFVVTGQVNSLVDCNPICITTDQLKALYNNYGWDIASHTVDHADLVTNSTAWDNYELSASYDSLMNWGFTRSADLFAYPNGDYNPAVIGDVGNNHYIMARTLNFGITQPNMFPNDPYNLSYRIQSVVMTPDVTAAMTYNYINQVVLEKGLLVLAFHVIQPNPQGDPATSVEYSTANFTAISNYLSQMQKQGLLQVTNFSAYYSTLGVYSSSTTSTTTTKTSTSSTTTVCRHPSTSTILTTTIPGTTTTTIPATTTSTTTSSSSTTTVPGSSSTSSTSTSTVSTASTTVSGVGGGGVQGSTGEGSASAVTASSGIPCSTVGSSGHMPTIMEYINNSDIGSKILNFSDHDSVDLLYNATFTVVLNFITPTSVNISINCNPYTLPLNVSMLFLNTSGYAYFARLVNISYLPISKSVTLLVYRHPNMIPPMTSATSTTTTINSTTTLPQTTIFQPTTTVAQVSAPSGLGPALIGTGVAIAIAIVIGAAYSRRRKEPPRDHADKSDSSASKTPAVR